jgi:hypothetical protein
VGGFILVANDPSICDIHIAKEDQVVAALVHTSESSFDVDFHVNLDMKT